MSHLFRRRNGDADDLVSTSDMTPVDLAAVQADDALLNTLGRADVVRGDTDAELARVLMAWRRDVDAESIGPLVDMDTAVATISTARKPATRRRSMLGAVAAVAAVLVVAFAGVGLGARSAHPGDIFFPLTKVLYSKYARSIEAAQVVETELDQAQTALKEGDTSQARQSLQLVQENLAVIAEEQGRDRLATEHRKLKEMLQETPSPPEPASTPPPPPPPSGAPVPPVPPSEPATSTTAPVEPSSGSKPPTTVATTPPGTTTSAVPEPPTAETRSSGGPGPVDSEESPPPTVTASSR
ncbi:MAG: anti-sigma-D factor RsdA [Pseudonocardiaceae bacterium]